MSEGIKVGDKVRVSEDVPAMYVEGINRVFAKSESEIEVLDDGNARIFIETEDSLYQLVIPCKYLVKVDAEAKEPKFKIGDKVSINESSLKHGLRGEILTVEDVDKSDRTYLVRSRCMLLPIWLREDEVSLYTQPTEQTEAEEDARFRQKEAELDKFIKAEFDRMLHPEKYYTYEVTIDNVAMNWQRYEADLAKEVALKVANKYTDPKEAAEYAVSVAKAVVEGLKRK